MVYRGEEVAVRYSPGALDRAVHVSRRLDLVIAELRHTLQVVLPVTAVVLTRQDWEQRALARRYFEEGLANGNPADADFYRGKLQAARYFLTWEVPSCQHELNILEARDDTCLGMHDAWF